MISVFLFIRDRILTFYGSLLFEGKNSAADHWFLHWTKLNRLEPQQISSTIPCKKKQRNFPLYTTNIYACKSYIWNEFHAYFNKLEAKKMYT